MSMIILALRRDNTIYVARTTDDFGLREIAAADVPPHLLPLIGQTLRVSSWHRSWSGVIGIWCVRDTLGRIHYGRGHKSHQALRQILLSLAE